jgi:hypothetical protein
MDLTLPILISAIKAVWFLIPIFILVVIIKTPWFKGLMGEAMVNLGSKIFLCGLRDAGQKVKII